MSMQRKYKLFLNESIDILHLFIYDDSKSDTGESKTISQWSVT